MSSVWGMILQWGSIIKSSIELPVTRHRRDMTEKLLQTILNQNKQKNPILGLSLITQIVSETIRT